MCNKAPWLATEGVSTERKVVDHTPGPSRRVPFRHTASHQVPIASVAFIQYRSLLSNGRRPRKGSALDRDDNREYRFPRFVSKNAHALAKAAAELNLSCRWGSTATSSSMHVLPHLDQCSLLRNYPPTPPQLKVNAYFSPKAKCWLMGGIRGQFPRNLHFSAFNSCL